MSEALNTATAIVTVSEQTASRLVAANSAAILYAQSLDVRSDEDYQDAAEFLKGIKLSQKEVEATFADIKEQAHKAHKAVIEKENFFKKPLTEAERIVKLKLQQYHAEKERTRREEEARIREEQKKLADEQLRKAVELEAAGHSEQARAALQTASLIDALGTVVESEKPTAEGVYTQLDYDVKIVDEQAVPAYIAGVAIRAIDVMAIKRLVKATKGAIQIPGVVIAQTQSIRVRTK